MLIVAVVLSGCSSQIDPVLTRRPLVEPLPLTVGVYFTPEFRGHRSKCDAWLCPEYDLGPPSVALFELLLAGLFRDVVVLDAMPTTHSRLKVAGILVPAITEFHLRQVETQITYRVTLYSSEGGELKAGHFEGSGPPFTSEGARLAIRDAAAKFVKELRKELVVKRWLREAGVESTDPAQPQNN